jgi:hypothetical protein
MANRLFTIGILLTLMTGCSSVPLGILGGGGPNVAANTQIGRENNQTLLSVETGPKAERDVVTKTVDAQQVENVNVVNERVPIWIIIALVVGWLAPSPSEIGRGIYRLLARKRD